MRNFIKTRSSNVKYLGKISDKKKLAAVYNGCDIFMLLSRKTPKWEEWFGITLVEAMACGLPIIATDNVGPREIINDGVNGFLVKNGKELFSKFNFLVSNNKEREKFGNISKKLANNYDIEVLSKKIYQFFLLNGNHN